MNRFVLSLLAILTRDISGPFMAHILLREVSGDLEPPVRIWTCSLPVGKALLHRQLSKCTILSTISIVSTEEREMLSFLWTHLISRSYYAFLWRLLRRLSQEGNMRYRLMHYFLSFSCGDKMVQKGTISSWRWADP